MERTKRNGGRRVYALAAILLACCVPASAGIVMNATRYIYPASEREITVKITNKGSLPVLTQAWIDDGDPKVSPEKVEVPFNLTPPISRIETGKAQTLRVSYTGGELPADRESQFWLNIVEVPPKPEDGGETNKMQLAFRYRLKLYFRPKGLKGSSDAAAENLAWARAADGGLSVSNPADYHVTLNDLEITAGGESMVVEPFSIAPHATLSPVLPHAAKPGRVDVRYQSINDYGGFVPHSTTIDER
ncbi:MAG: fimbria/pilus periplasmic chaperone [Luteibacter sp.]